MFAIWFSNGYWRIGNDEDKETETCSIKAPASNAQWPTDLDGRWMYWNPDSKKWISKGGQNISLKFCNELPFNQDQMNVLCQVHVD